MELTFLQTIRRSHSQQWISFTTSTYWYVLLTSSWIYCVCCVSFWLE